LDHLVICYDYDAFWFYIDGKLQGKAPKKFETKFLESDSVMVGVTANKKNNRAFNGVVDDIEFYNKVLSVDEIEGLYNAPNPNINKVLLNRILIALTILIAALCAYFLIKYYIGISIKKGKERLEIANKLLENELRINRALMNPHFIFNSMNTLHNYILINDTEKASDYLVKFSGLIRKILESNMSDTITLEMEIELLQRYLEIESLRFGEHIQSQIIVDHPIMPSTIIIPIMMLQPFVENSVWHGLRDKTGDKMITITFSLIDDGHLLCIIDDNGSGRTNKVTDVTKKQSMATRFVQQRLDLLNKIHNSNSNLTIIDKPNSKGTIIKIVLPILNK
jgi:LytS/YehU family sensor histidine kinase